MYIQSVSQTMHYEIKYIHVYLYTCYVLLKRPKPTEKSLPEHRQSIEKTTMVSQRLITTERSKYNNNSIW